MPAHKVSLIIQSTLGGIDTLSGDREHKFQYGLDQNIIFQHARRLIRCIVDCQSSAGDSIALRNALSLSRSLGARVWDDSSLYLQQLEGIGPVMVRKLINANIRGIEELESTEPGRIELILSKKPPAGLNLLRQVKDFPRLFVSVKTVGEPVSRQIPNQKSILTSADDLHRGLCHCKGQGRARGLERQTPGVFPKEACVYQHSSGNI